MSEKTLLSGGVVSSLSALAIGLALYFVNNRFDFFRQIVRTFTNTFIYLFIFNMHFLIC